MITCKCDYCGTVNEIAPGFVAMSCVKCGAALRENFAYYPVGVPASRGVTIAAAEDWSVTGADLSYWQGDIDWPLFASKVNFAYLRAGYGNDYTDPRLTEYMLGCAGHGIPFGLYWYAKPGKDWAKHANSFARYEEMGALPPVLDVEETGGLGKTALDGWLSKLINRYESVTGRQLAIYTSPGFWNSNLPLTNWAKHHPLWVAHWTSASQPTQPNDWRPKNNPDGYPWTFWQWSAGGNKQGAAYGVSSGDIDLNRYNGDREAFKRAFGVYPHDTGGEVPPPPEPPEEPPAEYPKVITLVGAFNLRQEPVYDPTNIMKTLPGGYKLKVIGEEGEWYKVSAWIHKDCDGK